MRLFWYVLLCLMSLGLVACESETEPEEVTAGTEAAGTEAAGTEAAGTEVAGTEVAGTEAAGTEVAGTEVAGTEVAGQSAMGFMSAEDLSMRYTQLGVDAQEVVNVYCMGCADSELCGDTLFDTTTSVEQATCTLDNSDDEQLSYLAGLVACEGESIIAMSTCVEMLSTCDDEQFTECLYLYGAECDYDYGYIAAVEYACFDGPEPFTCTNGEVIPGYWYCDDFPDCADESDEPADCPAPFVCADGTEISNSWVCDNEADCTGGEDEANCNEGE